MSHINSAATAATAAAASRIRKRSIAVQNSCATSHQVVNKRQTAAWERKSNINCKLPLQYSTPFSHLFQLFHGQSTVPVTQHVLPYSFHL
jgi:hypothetical protein